MTMADQLKTRFLMRATGVFVRQSDANARFLLSSGDATGLWHRARRAAAVGNPYPKYLPNSLIYVL